MNALVTEACHAIWKRYAGEDLAKSLRAEPAGYDRAGWNDALTYLSGVVNRQIIKGNGVLAFNSILLATIRLGSSATRIHAPWQLAATAASAGACLFVLALFRVDWATPREYDTVAREFEHTMQLIAKRSLFIEVALYLSAAGLLVHVLGLALRSF